MSRNVIDAADASVLEILDGADLSIVGGDDERIYLVFDDDEGNNVERDGDTIRIRAHDDLNVRLPRRLHVRVGHANGDVHMYDLDGGVEAEASGDVQIQSVRGDVALSHVSGDLTVRAVDGMVRGANVAGDAEIAGCRGVELGQVSGDLTLKAIDGAASVAHVSDDATVDGCTGEVRLSHVGDDVVARNLTGGLTASHVGGDLRLETPFAPGCTYEATCGGSAEIVLVGNPAEASVAFELSSGEGNVQIHVPLVDARHEPNGLRGRLGNGEAMVRIQSGEHVRLTSGSGRGPFQFPGDAFEGGVEAMMEGLGQGIEAAISGAFDAFGGAHLERFGHRMEGMGERIARRAEEMARRMEEMNRREVERAQRRAEQAGRRAAEQAERNARRFERRAGRWQWGPPGAPGGWPFTPPTPPAPPPPPARPRATEEERLVILRMLAEEKITTEEASRLLEALGA